MYIWSYLFTYGIYSHLEVMLGTNKEKT